jgi:hypothetical protein
MLRLETGASPSYHWRGIRRSDALVVRSSGAVALITRFGLALSSGASANAELERARLNRRSDLALGARGFSEWGGWVQAEYVRPEFSFAGNLTRTVYRRAGGNLSVNELFGRIEWLTHRGLLRAEAWQDVSGHRGGYGELSAKLLIANPLTGPLLTHEAGTTTGFAWDQVAGPAGVPDHAGTKVTHEDLSVALRFSPRIRMLCLPLDLDLDLTPHYQIARDSATYALRRNGSLRKSFFWLELRAGLSFTAPTPVRQ